MGRWDGMMGELCFLENQDQWVFKSLGNKSYKRFVENCELMGDFAQWEFKGIRLNFFLESLPS